MFGFPVKCVEASWLLELVFYCFSSYSCDFGHEFCYLGLPKPIIWRPVAGTILSAWGHPGGPWEQQQGHVGVRSKIFSDFGLILGPHFESFLSSDGLNSVFFWRLFPGHFLHRFLGGIICSWSSWNKVFVWKVLQKPFFGDSKVDFLCFLEALGSGFLTFSALETNLKIECFLRSPWVS